MFNLTQEPQITQKLVSLENVSSIDFVYHVVQAAVVAVGDDGLALRFELLIDGRCKMEDVRV